MRISIVGTGYVGLVTGACLADRGHTVTCVDVDAGKVAAINSGLSPIHEKDLRELLVRNVGKRLHATTDLGAAVRDTDITFIAVGTPTIDGRISLEQVKACAQEIGRALGEKNAYHTVVVKSTVIPGTTDTVVRKALEATSGKKAGPDFGLGMNPEFLTEGRAVEDFSEPDRIVLGAIDSRTHETLKELYSDYADVPIVLTNPSTAEMIKYASNALLATMISFSNELGRLCSTLPDTDIIDVMRGVHLSTYLTDRSPDGSFHTASIASFLEAGCGFGGSCLPKDVAALVAEGQSLGLPMSLLHTVLDINKTQSYEILSLVDKHLPSLKNIKVAVLGLAFKPDTDDVRESPAFPVIEGLLQRGASVTVCDPVANPEGDARLRAVRLTTSLVDAVRAADIVILVTRWPEFQSLPEVLLSVNPEALVIDGRRVLAPASFRKYEGIGRRSQLAR